MREHRAPRGDTSSSVRGGGSTRPSRSSAPTRTASNQNVKNASASASASTAGNNKERYPKAEFARREGMLEGLPAVMEVNRALKGYAFKKDFEWCLRLAIGYNAAENGQPLGKEEQVLELLEQRVFGLLKKTVNGHYVGHTSWGGSREFVFYIDDGAEAEEPLNAFASSQKRPMEFSLECDPQWAGVADYFNYTD